MRIGRAFLLILKGSWAAVMRSRSERVFSLHYKNSGAKSKVVISFGANRYKPRPNSPKGRKNSCRSILSLRSVNFVQNKIATTRMRSEKILHEKNNPHPAQKSNSGPLTGGPSC